MINKNQFKEMAKKVMRKQHGLRDPQIMHPEREWLIGIVGALVIFFFCVFCSIYAYIENKSISFEQAHTQSDEVVVYRESLVKDALGQFAERKEVLDGLVGTHRPPRRSDALEAATSTATSSNSAAPAVETASSTAE